MIDTAYSGTRVIELASGLSAGVAGRFFADLGADVVRIEAFDRTPGGPGAADAGERGLLAWSRAGKRYVSTPGSGGVHMADVEPLLRGADLLITDLTPDRWDGSFPPIESIPDAYPGTVVLDITPFGRVGPYAGYLGGDLVILALSGYLFVCGLNDREPLRLGVDVVDVVTGVNAAGGAMAGLHHARRTGQGQVVEVSTLRTALCMAMSFAVGYSFNGTVRRRSSTPMFGIGIMTPCKDGYALINTMRAPSELLYVLLEDERLLDEKFADYIGREVNEREMAEVMIEAAAGKTMRELFERGQELRLQNAMVQSPRQTPSDPQHQARHFFKDLDLEDGTAVAAPLTPVVPVGARRGDNQRRGVPLTTTEERSWACEPVAREPFGTPTTPSRKAFDGLKVVELTFAWAGPFIGRILADHGAQVVKVESRKYPDTARGAADLADLSFGENDRWMDRSLAYVIANPAKYHVGMELTDPDAREVLLDLVRWADVVIENFTPRVLPNLGLGWELFHSVNPSLVMISATGFGQQGPYRDYGAWGWGLECQAGITHATGYAGDAHPLMFSPTIPDPLSAATGVAAVLAALEERRRTGEGQRIDLSQYECATFTTLTEILRPAAAGQDRPRTGNRHAWRAPQGVYPCEGPDAWVAVAVETDAQWLALCEVIGRPDLGSDRELLTHQGRYAEHDRIDDAVAAWTRVRTKHQAMHLLQQAGVPAGAVQNAKDIPHDPQVRAFEFFRAAWGSEIGLRVLPGTWYGMQVTPGDVRRGPSTFGEDNERVLRDLLGYEPDRIETLLAGQAFSDIADGLQKPAAPGLPVEIMLERGTMLSWDDDYRSLPAEVAESNQRWRREQGLPEARLDGRAD